MDQLQTSPEDTRVPDDDILARSVFVKNVEYSATVKELEEHFKECGAIKRTKIGVDKATGQPLGYAYIEFEQHEGAVRAKLLSESLFKGRQITVMPKRKN